jgi:uncharacterized Zn finger protein
MNRDTLIGHKEAIIVCEESGHVSLNYNVLLTTPKANIIVKSIVLFVIAKSTLTCINCGKIGHTLKTYHNRKRKVPIISTTTIKFTELVATNKTQPAKLGRIHVCYPCIICVEHRFGECTKKY